MEVTRHSGVSIPRAVHIFLRISLVFGHELFAHRSKRYM